MVIAIVRLPDGLEQIETAYASALSAFLTDDATKCEDEFHKSGIDLN